MMTTDNHNQPPNTDPILLEIDADGIALITFNRPQAHNALNLAAMNRFAQVVRSLVGNPDLRAVVLTGAGDKAFCSGGDLIELSQYEDEAFARDFTALMGDALLLLERLPVPVIAAINGYALGGGSEIAMACDMRVIDREARMGFVQIRLALTPGWGAGQRLLRHVGYTRAMEILLEGRPMHADELFDLGLANHVTEPGRALERALHLARKTCDHSRGAVFGVKMLLQAGMNYPYEQALMIERDLFPRLWASEEHIRAVAIALNTMRRNDNNNNKNASSTE